MSEKKDKRISTVKRHDEMMAKWMKDPAFKTEYDALEEEYQLLKEMLQARKRAKLTQEQVAKRMGTKAPAITRLESSLSSRKHSPSLSTLQRYAEAVGCVLQVKLIKSQGRDASFR